MSSLHRLSICGLLTAVLIFQAFGPRIWAAEEVAKTTAAVKDAPATPAAAEQPAATHSGGKLTFNFRYQPWKDVLDWFAEQADLSLVLEAPPPGTFNYHDARSYTPAEALDVINSVLLTKGFTLVRNGRMLVLVNLEDGIPPNLVTDVPLAELDQHGEYEIIRVAFPVFNMTAAEAAEEVKPLLGPQGSVIVLPQAKRIQVTETGGRLRAIRSVINAVERPTDDPGSIREIPLEHLTFNDAMPYLRQLLGIPNEAFVTADGQLTLGKDVTGTKLLVHGTPERDRSGDGGRPADRRAGGGATASPACRSWTSIQSPRPTRSRCSRFCKRCSKGTRRSSSRWTRSRGTWWHSPGRPSRPRSGPRSTRCSATPARWP